MQFGGHPFFARGYRGSAFLAQSRGVRGNRFVEHREFAFDRRQPFVAAGIRFERSGEAIARSS